MVLLMFYALLAGAGTALSPCVLPVLPIVLGAGVTGGRRRPLGIVVGLVLSFTFTIVALVYVINALGLPNDLLRWIAIAVLLIFGVSLLVPTVSDRIEAAISRVVPGPSTLKGEGFGAGLIVGLSLGVVYTPCAGPILAAVITTTASQDFTGGRLFIALAYAIGTGAVLFALMIGGRKLTDRIKPHTGQIQAATGVLMVVFAVLMSFSLDTRFQTAIASDLPSWMVNPTGGAEKKHAVETRLADLRGDSHPSIVAQSTAPATQAKTGQPSGLPVYGMAPEFTDPGMWFNTPGDKPLTMAGLRGGVTLIDFWTYTCINCIRTLPRVESLSQQYGKDGLTVVGVHTPEFAFEHDSGNVQDAINQNHLTYPVVQDNDYGTWNAYGNQYWPAEYLVDAKGQVRYAHFGEGGEDETEQAIRSLLSEAGKPEPSGLAPGHAIPVPTGQETPETYLAPPRAAGFANGRIRPGNQNFGENHLDLKTNQFAYGGNWNLTGESGTSPGDATAGAGATIDVQFRAQQVYLVLGSTDTPRKLGVMLDGQPISAEDAGADVKNASATISGQRLYRLVDLPASGEHRLSLSFAPGIKGYAFTFG